MGQSNSLVKSFQNITSTVSGWKLVEVGINSVRNSISGAVAQVDALNKFPIVLGNLGYSAEQSQASIEKLRAGISGLPTSLNEVVTNVQRMAGVTGDLTGATDTVLALNNAFIVSGSSAADASRGMIQYNQMLSSGKVDAMSYRTLTETMGTALRELAQSFGYASAAVSGDFYKALQSGRISFEDLNNRVIELSNATGGFADRAKESAVGIGDAFAIMKKSIVDGVASAIQSANQFGLISASLKTFGTVVGGAIKAIGVLSPALLGLGASYAIISTINGISNAMQAAATSARIYNETQLLRQSMTSRDIIVESLRSTAIQSGTAAEAIRNAAMAQGITVNSQMNLVKSNGILVTQAETQALLASATGYSAAGLSISTMLGPLSLLITGITLLVGWIQNANAKQKAYNDAMDQATGRTKSAQEAIADLSKQYGVSAIEAKKLYDAQQQNTQGFNNSTEAVKEFGSQTFKTYKEALEAIKDYRAQKYKIEQDEMGNLKVVRIADEKNYNARKAFFDNYLKEVSESQRRGYANMIMHNRELYQTLKADWEGSPQIGVDYAAGIEQGLLSQIPAIRAAAKRVADALAKATKDGLQEKSPSKIAIRIGKFWDDGIVMGLLGGISNVKNAATQVASNIEGFGTPFLGLDEYATGTTITGVSTGRSVGNSGSVYNDHSVMNLMVNGIEEMDAMVDWWNNKRLNERSAGAGA